MRRREGRLEPAAVRREKCGRILRGERVGAASSRRIREKSWICARASSIAAARAAGVDASRKSVHSVLPRKRTPPITTAASSRKCTEVPAQRSRNRARVPGMLPP